MNSESSCTDSSDEEQIARHTRKYFQKSQLNTFKTRPNVSHGYWLSCLLPLALSVVHLKENPTWKISRFHGELALAACGMCLQTLCFFLYSFCKLGLAVDLCISCVPALLITLLYKFVLMYTWWWAFFWSFSITYAYQRVYILVMHKFPHCFSFGECAIFVQGLMLFLLNASQRLPAILKGHLLNSKPDIFAELAGIMLFALCCLCVTSIMIYNLKWLQTATGFYPTLGALVLLIFWAPITEPVPILKVLHFVFGDRTRYLTVAFYGLLLLFTVLTVIWQLRYAEKASTRIRKIFHVVIVLVFVPGVLFECALLFLATGVAFAVFCVLEIMRLFSIPPLGQTLISAFGTFADSKDSGALALTPFCLLIGCALPLWISPYTCLTAGDSHLLSHVAGILAVGVGDTAASVIGSKFGKRKWQGGKSSRSVEGTVAFVLFVLLAVMGLNVCGFLSMCVGKWVFTALATIVTALVEAQTDQIDNLVLPMVFYIIVSLA